jgi:transcriptional regulator with XRE-family HTH domain
MFDSAGYVKRAREKLKLTQAELAEALELERRTIMRYEQGEHLPRQTRLAIRQLLDARDRKTQKLSRYFLELEKKKLTQNGNHFVDPFKKNGADHLKAGAKEGRSKKKKTKTR